LDDPNILAKGRRELLLLWLGVNPTIRMVELTLTHGMVQADPFGRFHPHNG